MTHLYWTEEGETIFHPSLRFETEVYSNQSSFDTSKLEQDEIIIIRQFKLNGVYTHVFDSIFSCSNSPSQPIKINVS